MVFLGGNDLRNHYDVYSKGADPSAFISSLLDNYASIVQHIKSVKSTAQIVICTAPDVGATPSVQSAYPDPAKRALVTSLTETLNAGIAQLAASQGLGLADIYAFTKEYLTSGTISIGGIPLIKGSRKDNYPTYIFSEDNFHPNTCAQALFANEIIQAFNDSFQAGITPLSDSEILAYLASQHGVKLPTPAPTPAPTPVPAVTGTFVHDFSVKPLLWDLTGSYEGEAGPAINLEFSLKALPSGKLNGAGTLNWTDSNGVVFSGNTTLSGAVKSSGTATTLVALTVLVKSGSGTALLTGSTHNFTFAGTIKVNADINQGSGELRVAGGSASFKEISRTKGKKINETIRFGSDGSFVLPGDVTGDWTLLLELIGLKAKYTGQAIVQTSPLPETPIHFVANGNSTPSGTSILTLKGSGSSLNLVVLLSASNSMTVQSLKGKTFGQSLNYTAP